VFVDANGKFFVGRTEMAESEIPSRLKAIVADKTDKTVYLKGDTDARYSSVMKMMDALRKAQIDTVGLITEKKEKAK
jgi:biopolymer transport protein ExbD